MLEAVLHKRGKPPFFGAAHSEPAKTKEVEGAVDESTRPVGHADKTPLSKAPVNLKAAGGSKKGQRQATLSSFFQPPQKTAELPHNTDGYKSASQGHHQGNQKKERTFQPSWKVDRPWLATNSDQSKLFGTWCQKYDKYNAKNSFVNGNTVMKKETVRSHALSQSHIRAQQTYQRAVMAEDPAGDSKAVPGTVEFGVNLMTIAKRECVAARFNTAFYLAIKERLFRDFPSLVELQEKNGVRPSTSYRSEVQAKQFVTYIAQHEEKKIVADIQQNDFISILSDSSTNVADIDEEAIEVRILDPKTFKPCYKFLALKALK